MQQVIKNPFFFLPSNMAYVWTVENILRQNAHANSESSDKFLKISDRTSLHGQSTYAYIFICRYLKSFFRNSKSRVLSGIFQYIRICLQLFSWFPKRKKNKNKSRQQLLGFCFKIIRKYMRAKKKKKCLSQFSCKTFDAAL